MAIHQKIKGMLQSFFSDLCKATLLRWLPGLYPYARFRPFMAALQVTDGCNLKCVMCNQWKDEGEGELSLDEWKRILEELKSEGVESVCFSGGEPLLRNDLLDIVACAKRLGFDISLYTNGYLLDTETAEQLVRAGVQEIFLSLDATGRAYDEIRGMPGAYEKAERACRVLSGLGADKRVRAYISFTLMRSTLDTVEDVMQLARRYELPVSMNLVDVTPYFFRMDKEARKALWVEKNSKALLKVRDELILRKKGDIRAVSSSYSEIDYLVKYFDDPLQKRILCMASQHRIGVDAKGNVFGGCWSLGHFGNLREQRLSRIVGERIYKETHRKMFFKECPGCSCWYGENVRYHLPSLAKDALACLGLLRH